MNIENKIKKTTEWVNGADKILNRFTDFKLSPKVEYPELLVKNEFITEARKVLKRESFNETAINHAAIIFAANILSDHCKYFSDMVPTYYDLVIDENSSFEDCTKNRELCNEYFLGAHRCNFGISNSLMTEAKLAVMSHGMPEDDLEYLRKVSSKSNKVCKLAEKVWAKCEREFVRIRRIVILSTKDN